VRYLFLILVTFIIGCTKDNHMDQGSISFEFSKEAISSIDLIQNQTTRHLFDSNIDTKDELFSKSWISMIKTTQNFNRELVIEVEEHKPIAKLNEGRFFTQEGRIIEPGNKVKQLDLMKLIGADSDIPLLLDFSISLQEILNLKGISVVEFKHIGSDFLEAEDHLGTKYSFTKEDFRVQLERLEEFILFELNSGSIDDIRYIDLRYKNAIAVKGNNMEKST